VILDHILSSVKTQFFFEWSRTSYEQSLAEICTIFLEEHLQVTLEILIVVSRTDQSGSICSSLVIVLAREMLMFAFMLFMPWLNSSNSVNGDIVVLEICIVVRK
jgi:hypothetical protein